MCKNSLIVSLWCLICCGRIGDCLREGNPANLSWRVSFLLLKKHAWASHAVWPREWKYYIWMVQFVHAYNPTHICVHTCRLAMCHIKIYIELEAAHDIWNSYSIQINKLLEYVYTCNLWKKVLFITQFQIFLRIVCKWKWKKKNKKNS